MFFDLVSILFTIVPDYGNEYMTEENKNWTSLKKFPPKLNFNHNVYPGLQANFKNWSVTKWLSEMLSELQHHLIIIINVMKKTCDKGLEVSSK